MKISAGQTVLITGAPGGLGTYITEALAERGVKLGLVAYPGAELDMLRQKIEKRGNKTLALGANFGDRAKQHQIVDGVPEELGESIIRINNAGVNFTSPAKASV